MTGRKSVEAFLSIGLLLGGASRAWGTSRDLASVEGGGALLGAAVRDARAVALDRIGEREDCRELFAERGFDGASLLQTASYRQAAPNEAGGLCEKGAAAFTGMMSGRTALCADSFLKLGRHYGAVVLIHEALHVAGLGQHPHHPGAQTPQEIDRMVRSRCGL
jgi:hypothetical protein